MAACRTSARPIEQEADPHAKVRAELRERRLLRICDVTAPVLLPGCFIVTWRYRLFLAEANCVNAPFRDTQYLKQALDAVGAALTEREVVLTAAALIAIAFHGYPCAPIGAQVLSVRFHNRLEFGFNGGFVEIVVHALLGGNYGHWRRSRLWSGRLH